MRIFKFGGASVKDANSLINLAKVLKKEGIKNAILVVSAMGKMTNAFEKVIHLYFDNSPKLIEQIDSIRQFHLQIVNELFLNKNHFVYTQIEQLLGSLTLFLAKNKSKDYNYVYDQVVGFGELLSTKIVSAYLKEVKINNNWIDVRTCIKTDSSYRDARINWQLTSEKINELNLDNLIITQGFLGADKKNKTTTLGREGSDFTAAIFAFCLQAKSVTIWKDVPGVLNADPRYFNETILLNKISYKEAIEMAFYGASVIHPKTLKPLENQNIPLIVRSFSNLKNAGTKVSKGVSIEPNTPCFIVKHNQILLAISALDFSFIMEENISHIFKILHQFKLKVNLIQNSALSFSVCVEDKYRNFSAFIKEMELNYQLEFIKDVSLYTIRHANLSAEKEIEEKGKVILKQVTKEVVQFVVQ